MTKLEVKKLSENVKFKVGTESEVMIQKIKENPLLGKHVLVCAKFDGKELLVGRQFIDSMFENGYRWDNNYLVDIYSISEGGYTRKGRLKTGVVYDEINGLDWKDSDLVPFDLL